MKDKKDIGFWEVRMAADTFFVKPDKSIYYYPKKKKIRTKAIILASCDGISIPVFNEKAAFPLEWSLNNLFDRKATKQELETLEHKILRGTDY